MLGADQSLSCAQVLEGEEHSRVSRINLIDLAGSERSSIANTTGERLRVCVCVCA